MTAESYPTNRNKSVPHLLAGECFTRRAACAFLLFLVGQTASAQSLQPGDLLLMSAAGPMPGAGEAHPAIRLHDGSICDLLSLICLARAEDEFGSEVYAKRDEMIRQLVQNYRTPAGRLP